MNSLCPPASSMMQEDDSHQRERASSGQVLKAPLAMTAMRDTLNQLATLVLLAAWGRKPEQASLGTCQNLMLANCCERRQS